MRRLGELAMLIICVLIVTGALVGGTYLVAQAVVSTIGHVDDDQVP